MKIILDMDTESGQLIPIFGMKTHDPVELDPMFWLVMSWRQQRAKDIVPALVKCVQLVRDYGAGNLSKGEKEKAKNAEELVTEFLVQCATHPNAIVSVKVLEGDHEVMEDCDYCDWQAVNKSQGGSPILESSGS